MSKAHQKRVVSKAEYRQYLAKRYGILIRYGLIVIGILCGLCFESMYVFHRLHPGFWALEITSAVTFLATMLGGHLTSKTRKDIRLLEPVEPVSRHNVDRLDPAEALVRGSDAPHTPEAVLLRATTTMTETPQEQLLRPSE